MTAIVLASTSPYRRALLARLGVPFECVAPDCDEDVLKTSGLPPAEMVEQLAEEKARSVATGRRHAIVIGSDQCGALGEQRLDKPGTAERAVEQLLSMQGRTHELLTAMCVAHAGGEEAVISRARLTMRTLSRDQLERYVAADETWDCAGGYKLESRGIALFERVETDDHTAIIGLPLLALVGVLTRLGVALP